MGDDLILRRGARVLLLDAANQVLMFRGYDPADPLDPPARYWFTVGGGLDEGESEREGAARELFEEAGLRVDPAELVGPVHHEVTEFPFLGRRYRQDQVFFVLRVSAWQVDTSGFEQIERESIDAHRWWSADELRATGETCYPPDLPDLLDRVLADSLA